MTNTATNQNVHRFEQAGLGKAPFRVVGFSESKYQACPGAPIQPGSSCDYCGTGIMNVFLIKAACGKTFKVGCDCVAKVNDPRLVADVKVIQKQRRDEAKVKRHAADRQARKEAAEARYLSLPADLREALENSEAEIVQDIAKNVRRTGWISARQEAVVWRLSSAVVGCALPEPVAAPVTDARILVEGLILGVKVQESFYGDTLKMLVGVRTPLGLWKCWGTVPQFVHEQRRWIDGEREELKGMAVQFMARIEVSKDDPCFSFFSRPTAPKAARK